ncbi:hypothetical protein MIR68_012378 [Amoeboaphelidium protococcarum]|nr:hypothetical protein MIR68_012378 [Amoeboaphelidium protococcarum]
MSIAQFPCPEIQFTTVQDVHQSLKNNNAIALFDQDKLQNKCVGFLDICISFKRKSATAEITDKKKYTIASVSGHFDFKNPDKYNWFKESVKKISERFYAAVPSLKALQYEVEETFDKIPFDSVQQQKLANTVSLRFLRILDQTCMGKSVDNIVTMLTIGNHLWSHMLVEEYGYGENELKDAAHDFLRFAAQNSDEKALLSTLIKLEKKQLVLVNRVPFLYDTRCQCSLELESDEKYKKSRDHYVCRAKRILKVRLQIDSIDGLRAFSEYKTKKFQILGKTFHYHLLPNSIPSEAPNSSDKKDKEQQLINKYLQRETLSSVFFNAMQNSVVPEDLTAMFQKYKVDLNKMRDPFNISKFNDVIDLWLLQKADCTNGEFTEYLKQSVAILHNYSRHNQMLLMVAQCAEDSALVKLFEILTQEELASSAIEKISLDWRPSYYDKKLKRFCWRALCEVCGNDYLIANKIKSLLERKLQSKVN